MSLPAPGFADPVLRAQSVFRALLDAFARPGTIAELPMPDGRPDGLSPAQAAIALTLLDADTPVWLSAGAAAARGWIAFHTGAPTAAGPADALFAFAAPGDAVPDLAAFALGSDAYPDRSTTLVLETPGLAADGDRRLTGPGIDGEADAHVPLDPGFWAQREALAEIFPRGLDLALTDGTRVLALPRTTRVEKR